MSSARLVSWRTVGRLLLQGRRRPACGGALFRRGAVRENRDRLVSRVSDPGRDAGTRLLSEVSNAGPSGTNLRRDSRPYGAPSATPARYPVASSNRSAG